MSDSDLFTPLTLGGLELPHRIVMAPMTRSRAGPGRVPREMNAVYYAQRASAALIVTEATQVSWEGVGYPDTPGIHGYDQIEGWAAVTKAVHEADGRIFCQLVHCGRISHPALQPGGAVPVAPSAIRPEGTVRTPGGKQPYVTPHALTREEIGATVNAYYHASMCAKDAGFDGVEIHAGNGYLPDQFLRDGSNVRTDDYGGDAENRARFLIQILEAAAMVFGPDRVGVRISPMNPFNDMRDSDPQATFGHLARSLAPAGLAYLHVVESAPAGESFDFGALRDAFGGTYVANSGYDLARGNAAIAEGRADLVSFARLFLANPDLPRRLAEDAPLADPDPSTFYGGGEKGYTDYPTL
jgi:N-ethylmaleimide reductase